MLQNPMCQLFLTYIFYMRYACEVCRFRIVPFEQPRNVRENMLIMRHLIRIRAKFQLHNPDVLHHIISGMQSENTGVMLPKFHPDLNQTSCYKHALSITLE
jgi:hypothetical protein